MGGRREEEKSEEKSEESDGSSDEDDKEDDDEDDDDDDDGRANKNDNSINKNSNVTVTEREQHKIPEHAYQLWIVLGVNLFIISMAIIIGMVFCRSGSSGTAAFYNMLPGLHSSRLTLGSRESLYSRPKFQHPSPDYLEYSSALIRQIAMPTTDDGLISRHELDIGQRLGGGQFSDTYLAEWKERTVAAKRIMVNVHQTQLTEDDCTWICAETVLLSKQRHKHIVSVLGTSVDTRQPYVVTEYVSGESLHDLLRRQEEEMGWSTKMRLCLDFCEGMAYLHSARPPVLHRDLRSANILVNVKMKRAKVVDFGMTHIVQRLRRECNSKQAACFCQRDMCAVPQSVRWTAPEVLYHPTADESHDQDVLTTAVDVYSVAMVFWEVATAKDPFDDIPDDLEVVDIVKAGGRPRLDLLHDLPMNYAQLVKMCWSHDRKNRPTMKQVLVDLKQVFHHVIKSSLSDRHRTLSSTATGRYMKSLFGSQEVK